MSSPIVILGCGYVGTAIARAALAAGRQTRVCGRSTGKLQPLGAEGAVVKFLDASTPKNFTSALNGMHGASVVYSIPPVTSLPPGHAMRAAMQAAYGVGAANFIHFSSSGLYGEEPDDETWIDEDTPLTPDSAMQNIQSDEQEIMRSEFGERMKITILRLAPVYGPGRGVRNRIRKGEFRILDEGQHATSRIYIDDLVRIVFACEDKAPHKSIYLVGDDEPTTQGEYAKWLSERMGLPMPPYRLRFEPGKQRVAHRNRRIKNTKLKQELGIELKYPSYREGEAAIEAVEGTG